MEGNASGGCAAGTNRLVNAETWLIDFVSAERHEGNQYP
jgi:hypothetical protein